MNTKQIKGLPVVSIAEGHRLGVVHRLYSDREGQQIAGLAIDVSGHSPIARQVTDLVQGKSKSSDSGGISFLPIEDVHAIGPDAVTIDEDAKLQTDRDPHAEGSDILDLDQLHGRKVVTEGGTYVGDVATIAIDPQSFQLTGVDASSGLFSGNTHIARDMVTSIGNDIIIVKNEVLPSEVEETPELAAGQRATIEQIGGDGDAEFVAEPRSPREIPVTRAADTADNKNIADTSSADKEKEA